MSNLFKCIVIPKCQTYLNILLFLSRRKQNYHKIYARYKVTCTQKSSFSRS